MDLQKEKELVERAKYDISAFDELYNQNFEKILNFIFKRVEDVSLAEDITSIVFKTAMEKLQGFKWRKKIPFSAWLFKIANSKISDHFRKNKKILNVSLDVLFQDEGLEPIDPHSIHDEIIEIEDKIELDGRCKDVRKKLRSLPIKYQEVLTLRFYGDKKISEISKILGRREGTIKSQINRGLKLLRNLYTAEEKKSLQPINKINVINNMQE